MSKLAISTTFNYDIPFDEMLPMIREAGFEAISLGGNRSHSGYHLPDHRVRIKRLASRHRLEFNSIHAPFKEEDGDISHPIEEIRKRMVANVQTTIDAAYELGVGLVILHLSARFEGPAISQRLESARRSLQALADYAIPKGVRLACENLPAQNSQEIFEAILSEFDQPHIGICYDSSHAHCARAGFEILRRYRARILALHISDDVSCKDDHLLPGEGNINWEEFREALEEINYQGEFILEPEQSASNLKESRCFLVEAYRRGLNLLLASGR